MTEGRLPTKDPPTMRVIYQIKQKPPAADRFECSLPPHVPPFNRRDQSCHFTFFTVCLRRELAGRLAKRIKVTPALPPDATNLSSSSIFLIRYFVDGLGLP
jgi:hypothetical protein